MKRGTGYRLWAGVLLLGIPVVSIVSSAQEPRAGIDNNLPIPNPGGSHATFSSQGQVDLANAFFRPQGTNGRSCATCHLPEDGWSITPATLRHLFDATGGTAPVFNLLDANHL